MAVNFEPMPDAPPEDGRLVLSVALVDLGGESGDHQWAVERTQGAMCSCDVATIVEVLQAVVAELVEQQHITAERN